MTEFDTTTLFNYGRCPCSGLYRKRTTEMQLVGGGEVVVVANIPLGACPQCGSRVYKASVLRSVETRRRSLSQTTDEHTEA